MSKPVIGISGPDRGGYPAWWFAALGVRLQGGRPLRIRPKRPVSPDVLDGLIIGGGVDIEPENTTGEMQQVRAEVKRHQQTSWGRWLLYPLIFIIRRLFSVKKPQRYDTPRDDLEFSLVRHAVANELPLLGICRGAQLINQALGGSLHEDIHEFYEEAPLPRSIFPVKKIEIAPGTRLASILELSECTVNALHHQAVDTLGQDMCISAREDNGLVQAIESTSHRFLVGVQWHPEYLPLERSQRRLFRALVAAATRQEGA